MRQEAKKLWRLADFPWLVGFASFCRTTIVSCCILNLNLITAIIMCNGVYSDFNVLNFYEPNNDGTYDATKTLTRKAKDS